MAMVFVEDDEPEVKSPHRSSVEADLPPELQEQFKQVREKAMFLKQKVNFHFSWRKKSHYYVHWIKLCERVEHFIDRTDERSFRKIAARRARHSLDVDLAQLKMLLDYAAWNDKFNAMSPTRKPAATVVGSADRPPSPAPSAGRSIESSMPFGEPEYVGFSTPDGDALQLRIYQEMSRIMQPKADFEQDPEQRIRVREDRLCKENGAPFNEIDKLFWYRYFGDDILDVKMGEFVKALRFHLIQVHNVPLPAVIEEDAVPEPIQQKRELHKELKTIRKIGKRFQGRPGSAGPGSPRSLMDLRGDAIRFERESFDKYKDEDAADDDERTVDMFEAMVRELCFDPFDRKYESVSDASWARFFVMYGPLDRCWERMIGVFEFPEIFKKTVRLAPWMQLEVKPNEANRYVASGRDDKFCIRRSQSSDSYVLVYWDGQRALNCRLKLTERGYMLEGDPRMYETLRRLIIVVTTEKGLQRSVQEQRQAIQWNEFIHREQQQILDEERAAYFNVNTYDELAEFLLYKVNGDNDASVDQFRKVERTILECIFSPQTTTLFSEIFLQLDADYSGALDNGEFAVGVPYVVGSVAKRWADQQSKEPLMGRLTQDITLGSIPIENFKHSLADPLTKIFIMQNEKTLDVLVKQYKSEHNDKEPNYEEKVWMQENVVREWFFTEFDKKSAQRASMLLGVIKEKQQKPRGFGERVLLQSIAIVLHLAFFPFMMVHFWFSKFGRRTCKQAFFGFIATILLSAFYYLPFASVGVWRYYVNNQLAHDINVYEIIIPVVTVVLLSFVVLPLESLARQRTQRWIQSKSRDAQLSDKFQAFKAYLKPTTDAGEDISVVKGKETEKRSKMQEIIAPLTTFTKRQDEDPRVPAAPSTELTALNAGGNSNSETTSLLPESGAHSNYNELLSYILLRFWHPTVNMETRDEEVRKTAVEPLLPDKQHFFSVIFYAFVAAGVHAVVPGVFRVLEKTGSNLPGMVVFGMTPFFGDGWQEHFCSIIHLVYGFIGGACLSVFLQNAVLFYYQQSMALSNINHLTSARSASQGLLPVYLPLDSVESVNFWLLMREKAKEPIDITLNACIAAALIEVLILVVAVFVRIVVLDEDIDIFAITGLYDILFLTVHLLAIVASAVKLNHENHNSSVWLEYQKFRYHMEIAQIKADTDRTPTDRIPTVQIDKLKSLQLKASLVKSTISKITRLDTPVAIFGLVVDQAFFVQLMAFVAVGAGSGIAQLINKAEQ